MTSGQPVPSNEPGQWEAELAGAFEVLLGLPLDDFDPTATYALFHWDDIMSAEFFDFFDDFDVLGSVVSPESSGAYEGGLSWTQWGLDLGRSLFLFDGDTATEAALRAASRDDSQLVVAGADLAPALTGQEFDPTEAFLTVLARVETDGTLFEAMRAATWTMDGPADLLEFNAKVDVEEAWEEPLKRVGHPALRDHLRMLCLTEHSARSEGAFYLGARRCPNDLQWLGQQPGHRFVTGWTFGEGQASSAIFQVPS
jgi:hypothetical protein